MMMVLIKGFCLTEEETPLHDLGRCTKDHC